MVAVSGLRCCAIFRMGVLCCVGKGRGKERGWCQIEIRDGMRREGEAEPLWPTSTRGSISRRRHTTVESIDSGSTPKQPSVGLSHVGRFGLKWLPR